MLCAAGLLASRPGQAKPNHYVLDPGASHLVVRVGKTGVFGFAGHEHEIVAGGMAGTVVVDPQHVGDGSVELTFASARLHVTGKGEPAGDVPKVQEAMVGPTCLDASRFPTIRFVSKAIVVKHAAGGQQMLEVRGELTLHGVTRPLTVPLDVELSEDRVTGRGRLALRQTDFRITPISVAGVVKVKDEVALEWVLVARRAP